MTTNWSENKQCSTYDKSTYISLFWHRDRVVFGCGDFDVFAVNFNSTQVCNG